MPQTVYEFLCIFVIYACLGWCTEVAYAAMDLGKFVNRGFLNGPYCPIYGVGVLIVIGALTPLKHNLLILFAGSFLLTSVLEYLTGWILEKVFHNKWWDYSMFPFNINGYVCLKFSVLWGLACSFIMLILHPLVYRFITVFPKAAGFLFLAVFLSAFAVDCLFTVCTILKLNRHLKGIDEIAGLLRELSVEIGENIYENVTEVMEKKEMAGELQKEIRSSVHENIEKRRSEYERLVKKQKELLETRFLGQERLLKAFPGMKSTEYNESLQKLREQLKDFVKSRIEKEE